MPPAAHHSSNAERTKNDDFDRTMKPVGSLGERRADERSGLSDNGLTIPHNTTASVRLLEELDTSNDEPIRAELRSSLVIKGVMVLPAGSIFSGRASLRYNRAQARFDKVTLPSGEEHRISALAITNDGRKEIEGGRLEFGELPPDKTARRLLAPWARSLAKRSDCFQVPTPSRALCKPSPETKCATPPA